MGLTINGQTYEFGQVPPGQSDHIGSNPGFSSRDYSSNSIKCVCGACLFRMMPGMMPQAPANEAEPEQETAPAPSAPSIQSKSKSFSI
jgi:hypothetical protein